MSAVLIHLSIPVDIGRDEARELAEQELLDPVYAKAKPPWWQEVASWVFDKLSEVVAAAAGSGAGLFWLLILVGVVSLIVFVIMRQFGGVQRSRTAGGEVFSDEALSAEQYRSLAEQAAGRQQWAEAIREGFRAIVRQLEERGALDRRPGRTADEAARDAGLVFDVHRSDLHHAAQSFDEVVYGDRPGSAAEYGAMRDLDRGIASTTQVAL